jgi:hypothetical protein
MLLSKGMSLKRINVLLGIFAVASLSLSGCMGGDTDGGKATDDGGNPFIPGPNTTGSVSLELKESEIPVSQTTGFTFAVVDANKQPVQTLQVSCDSESGVAIIEPTTGSEITDSSGKISGRIGCAAPGSFQFGCRLPIGGNLRKFVDVKCTGDFPSGFNGFPGAAGGGLGTGGVVNPGTDTDDVSVTGISILDNPGSSEDGDQIDMDQVICTPDDTTTTENELVVEPFTDTRVKFTVVNQTNSTIKFTGFTYSVPNFDGTGRTFESSTIRFIGDAKAESNGGEATLSALVFSVIGSGGDKFFVNATSGNKAIGAIGFRNIKFTITGTTSLDQEVSVSGTTVLSFANYDRCGS